MVLFVCSQNKLRSPTAEQMFSRREDLEVASAGTNHDAENPLTDELVAWADVIFVMEKKHRRILEELFGEVLTDKRIICLHVPDCYRYMEPALIDELKAGLSQHIELPAS